CSKTFRTLGGKHAHMSSAKSCSWYKFGKLVDLQHLDHHAREGGLLDVQAHDEEEPDMDPEEVMLDLVKEEELFHLVPQPESVEGNDNNIDDQMGGPGPSTQTNRILRASALRVLDDNDDLTVVDIHPTAGYIICMDQTLHTKWRNVFGDHQEIDTDGNVEMGDNTNLYAPFTSELDWRIPQWAVKDRPGQNAFDQLLKIPGVMEKLGLSYHNSRSLHQVLDNIPERAGTWQTRYLTFKDHPNQTFIIQHRNIIQSIASLWGVPEHAKYLLYAPRKIFTNSNKTNCIFSEMCTGKWWHAIQVSNILNLHERRKE
ncbi:hypothetical protein L208DRAFT_1333887, partial [Tricholoma matsutake]